MQQIVNVDGINLNATHYGAMSTEEGPKRILQDHHHITFGEAWAKVAHSECVKKVSPKAEVKAEAPAPVAEPAIAVEAEVAPAKAKK
jgi:hypothetical protein